MSDLGTLSDARLAEMVLEAEPLPLGDRPETEREVRLRKTIHRLVLEVKALRFLQARFAVFVSEMDEHLERLRAILHTVKRP